LVLIFVGKVCIFLGLVGWLRHMTGSWYYGIFKGLRAVNGWSGPPCLTSPTRAVPSDWQLRPWGQEMTTDDLWGTAVTRKSWSPKPRQTETDPQESNPSRVIFIGNDSLPGHSLPVLATCFRPGTQEQTDHRKAWIFSNEDLNQIACVG
jgi:hypothetical protein